MPQISNEARARQNLRLKIDLEGYLGDHLDGYREKHGIKTRVAAARELLTVGLIATGYQPEA